MLRMMATEPARSDRSLRHVAAKAGVVAAAFAVFTCGWLAMRADHWTGMVGFSALAVGAAVLASRLSRAGRSDPGSR